MARSAEKQGNDEKAIELLQQYLGCSNQNSSFHILSLNILAAIYEKHHDWPLAINCYQVIIPLKYLPSNSLDLLEAYTSIGLTFSRLNDISQANLRAQIDIIRDLLNYQNSIDKLSV